MGIFKNLFSKKALAFALICILVLSGCSSSPTTSNSSSQSSTEETTIKPTEATETTPAEEKSVFNRIAITQDFTFGYNSEWIKDGDRLNFTTLDDVQIYVEEIDTDSNATLETILADNEEAVSFSDTIIYTDTIDEFDGKEVGFVYIDMPGELCFSIKKMIFECDGTFYELVVNTSNPEALGTLELFLNLTKSFTFIK